jgi:hypothetical protein
MNPHALKKLNGVKKWASLCGQDSKKMVHLPEANNEGPGGEWPAFQGDRYCRPRPAGAKETVKSIKTETISSPQATLTFSVSVKCGKI